LSIYRYSLAGSRPSAAAIVFLGMNIVSVVFAAVTEIDEEIYVVVVVFDVVNESLRLYNN
jgi:hypothetical protein